MLDFQTAAGAYGFAHGVTPVGSIMAETNVGADLHKPSSGLGSGPLSLGTQNPLFWLLLLVLVFTGWVFGAFDFGVKRVGAVKVKAGR